MVAACLALGAGGCDKATPTAAAAVAADQPASVRPPAAPSAPDVAPARAAKKPAACPTTVAGASASVADVKDGIALTIAAKDAVAAADIRERARGLASVSTPGAGRGGGGGGDGNGPGDGSGGGGGGGAGGGGGLGRCPIVLRGVSIDVQDARDGAVVTMRPKDPRDLDWVRKQVRSRLATD